MLFQNPRSKRPGLENLYIWTCPWSCRKEIIRTRDLNYVGQKTYNKHSLISELPFFYEAVEKPWTGGAKRASYSDSTTPKTCSRHCLVPTIQTFYRGCIIYQNCFFGSFSIHCPNLTHMCKSTFNEIFFLDLHNIFLNSKVLMRLYYFHIGISSSETFLSTQINFTKSN